MLNTSGLALEQAPPLWVPLGFFLTAPLHLAAAGLLLTLGGASLWASRWTPGALAVVHLVLLGFLSQVMFGALLQVFPVLAGEPVPGVTLVSRGLWGLLNLGVPLQCAGFLSGERGLLLGGSLLVVAAVVLLLGVAGGPLLRAKGSRPTLVAMGLSLFALVVTAALGLVLVLGLVGLVSIPDLVGWTNVHLSWGQVAGVMGAKKTPDLIPMCHALLITSVDISFKEESQPNQAGLCAIHIFATVKTTGQTGVEMEAMTAASVAALTIYDMCKAIDRGMSFSDVCLLSKSGGKSGTYTRPD